MKAFKRMLVLLLFTFVVPLNVNLAHAFMFVSWADTKSARAALSELSDQAVLLNPDFTIYPGDLESFGFTLSGMNAWKEAMDGQLNGDTAPNGMFDIVFPVRGNHDDSNISGWQDYFDFQLTADRVGATNYTYMPGEEDLTYSFDYENAHFIGVDVAGSVGKITSAQITWIDDDLTAAEGRGLAHAFLYWHGPIYCVDGHCSCSQRTCSIDPDVESLIEVLNQHPIVSATFHGHEHTHAHTYIDETRIPPNGAFEGVTHPFHQFVTGSAGAGPRSCDANRCDYNMAENGFVTVDVDGPSVTVTFYQRGSMDPVNTINFVKEGYPTNEPPVANDDNASTPPNTAVTIDAAANDSDPDDNLDPASASTTCIPDCAEPIHGSLVNNSNGSFTYTPVTDYQGPDSFVYEICDTEGLCDKATVSITVTSPNDPPVADVDSASLPEDTSVTIDVASNDSDPDGNLDPSSVNTVCAGCAVPANGNLVNNADGTFDYTPNVNFNGADNFIYEICDHLDACDTASVTLTISPVNDAPAANDDPATTTEDTLITIDVATNDTDPDGNLEPASANTTCVGCQDPSTGALFNNGNGTFDYTPDQGFTGSDSFVYEICDTDALCDTATVNISVNPAAVSVDAVSYGTTADDKITISHTTSGTDRLMLVGVSINNDNFETVSSIAYNGVSLTYVNSETQSDDARVEIWQLVDPPLGTYDVVITFSADLKRYAVAGVTTFIGVDPTNPVGTFVGNNATSSTASLTLPSAPGELVLGVFSCETCTSVTFASPTNEQWNLIAGGGNEIGAGATIAAESSQVTINASLGASDHWALGGISIRPGFSGPPVNQPPVANDDSVSTPQDTPVTIDVAANDNDPEGSLDLSSTYTACGACTEPVNGVLVNNGDGTFEYTPDTAFNGNDSFVYEICDYGTPSLCDTATVSINVTLTNDPPVADDDNASTPEDTPLTINVAANDSDPDGNLDPSSTNTTCFTCAEPVNGALLNRGNGSLDYTPNPDFNGNDNFVYEICDTLGLCDTATVSITVDAVNDPPVANDDSASCTEATAANIDVVANDTDPEGSLDPSSANEISGPSNGALVNNGDGTCAYTPNIGFTGFDSFVYEVCDNGTPSMCDTATVSITVSITVNSSAPDILEVRVAAGSDDAEERVGSSASLNSSDLELVFDRSDQQVGMRFNGIDIPQVATITNAYIQFQVDEANSGATSLNIQGQAIGDAPTFVSQSGNISSRAKTTAAVPWSPVPWTTKGEAGADQRTPDIAEVIQEIVNRQDWVAGNSLVIIITGTGERTAESYNGVSAAAPLLHVEYSTGPPNQPPVANDDSASTVEDTPVDIDVAANDNDPDGNLNPASANETSGPSNGTLANNGDGSCTYTPDPDFSGTDSFVYEICDTQNACDTATVTITVDPIADPPVANDDSASTSEDTVVTIDVAANDSDSDGNLDPGSANETGAPSNGTLVNNGNGTFDYTPNNGFTGSDSFVYEICDSGTSSLCDTATVSINVTPTNDAPVAYDDSASIPEDTAVTIDVATNDSDPDGNLDPNSASVTTRPTYGSVVHNGNGRFTYTPDPDFNGSDSFGYQICDDLDACDTASVTLTVSPVNDAAAANNDFVTTTEETPITIDVAANDTDPDGNLDQTTANTTCVGCADPSYGTLFNNGNGTFDHTPDQGFTGSDSFVYEICDTDALCDTATVNISVNPAAVMVDAVSSGSTAGASLSITHPTSGTDRLMLVGVSINNDDYETVSAITYNGIALSYVNSETQKDDARVEIWQLVDPPVGTYDVVITFSADLRRFAVAGVTTFIGVDPTDPVGTFVGNNATSSSANLTVPSASGELVLGVFSCETCTSVTFAAPLEQQWNLIAGSGNQIGAGATIEAESSQVTINASLGASDHWALGGISIRPGSSGPPPNQPPVANDDSASTLEDTPVTIDVAANDSDPDGSLDLSSANSACAACADPANGSLANNGDGSFDYTPDPGLNGNDSFVYEICDNGIPSLCDTATVSISVTTAGGNLPPTASAGPDQAIGLFEDVILDGTVSDDGLPDPPGAVTTIWFQVSGPGTVTFADESAVDTTASFSEEGAYVLELNADDGELSVSDQVNITVGTASTMRVPQDYSTIQAAINAAQNGDLVLVSPGTYSGSLTLDKAVTLASTFYTTGDEADIASTILDGGGGSSVIDIPGSTPDRPTIMGFTIQNATDGIFPHAKFDFLHNIVRNMSDGIDYESGSGGLCQFNVFEMNSDDGIDLDGSVDIVIVDNIIRNNGDDGIEKRLHAYSGPTLNIIIRNNVISGNDEDGIQLIDYSDLSDRFILIEHNFIANNAMVGLGLMDNGDTSEDYRAASIPERIHVFNNTFSGNPYGLTGGDNLIALNNLFVNSINIAMKQVDGNSIAAYNLFWNNGTDEQGSNLDLASTLFADPLLDSEFRLQPASPAIDAGTSFFQWQGETVLDMPDTEFSGVAPDLGAYESDI